MAFRFTEQHAMSLVAPHLFPGEQVVARARGEEIPWYSAMFFGGRLFTKLWFVVATNQRILFVQHGGLFSGWSAKKTEAFAWPQLDALSLGWGIFNKVLYAKSAAQKLARRVIIRRFWMKGNFDAANVMVGTWKTNHISLPPAPMVGHLPAYAAPMG